MIDTDNYDGLEKNLFKKVVRKFQVDRSCRSFLTNCKNSVWRKTHLKFFGANFTTLAFYKYVHIAETIFVEYPQTYAHSLLYTKNIDFFKFTSECM